MQQAENTFKNGLLMDFNPTIQPNSVLTNALNATLVTFNGNEGSLQNDMGNGRVETAFLPEGFIPVGTTVFGGIIYIVSYNPLDNLCQIGCFPSPERNIASEEISEVFSEPLTNETFQELDLQHNPTGKIKTFTKQILIKEDDLNPGDKYLIYTENKDGKYSEGLWKSLSGLEKQHSNIKLHIVSIQESGKITYLDSTTQFYEVTSSEKNNQTSFQIPVYKENNFSLKEDIDTYREKVANNYSVFSERISGKLAILAELETINTFNCGHKVKTVDFKKGGVDFTRYDILINFNWESNDSCINPSYICIDNIDWDFSGYNNIIESTKDGNIYTEFSINTFDSKEIKTKVQHSNNLLLIDKCSINDNNLNIILPYINPEDNSYYKLKTDSEYSLQDFTSNLADDVKPHLLYSTTYVNNENNLTYARFLRADLYLNGEIKPANASNLQFYTPENYKNYQEWENNNDFFVNKVGSGVIVKDRNYQIDVPITALTKEENPENPKQSINKIYYRIPDDYINNILKHNCEFLLCSIELPKSITKDHLFNALMNYTITPAMDFGKLEHLSVKNSIDFKKIDTDDLNITCWKYFIPTSGQFLELEFNNDLYEKEGKKVSEIAIEFYDHVGYVGAYVFRNFDNYNGKINHRFLLNTQGVLNYGNIYNNTLFYQKYYTENLKLNSQLEGKDPNNLYWYHNIRTKINEIVKGEENSTFSISYQLERNTQANCFDNPDKDNDMGVLYSNNIYLCNIWYKYNDCDPITEEIIEKSDPKYKCISKYINTTGQFNSYYNTDNIDFDALPYEIPIKLAFTLEECSKPIEKIKAEEISGKTIQKILYDIATCKGDIKTYVNNLNSENVEYDGTTNKLEITADLNTNINLQLKLFPTIDEKLQKIFQYANELEKLEYTKKLKSILVVKVNDTLSQSTDQSECNIVMPFDENTSKLDVLNTKPGTVIISPKSNSWKYDIICENSFRNKYSYSNIIKTTKNVSEVTQILNDKNWGTFGFKHISQNKPGTGIVKNGDNLENKQPYYCDPPDYPVWEIWPGGNKIGIQPKYWYDYNFVGGIDYDGYNGNASAGYILVNSYPNGCFTYNVTNPDFFQRQTPDGNTTTAIKMFYDYKSDALLNWVWDVKNYDFMSKAEQVVDDPFGKNELFKFCGLGATAFTIDIHIKGSSNPRISDKFRDESYGYFIVPKGFNKMVSNNEIGTRSYDEIIKLCTDYHDFYQTTVRKSSNSTKQRYQGQLNTIDKVTMLTQIFTHIKSNDFSDCDLESDFSFLGVQYKSLKECRRNAYNLINKSVDKSIGELLPESNCTKLKLNVEQLGTEERPVMLTFIQDEVILPKENLLNYNTHVKANGFDQYIDGEIDTNGFYLPVKVSGELKLILVNNSLISNLIANSDNEVDQDSNIKEVIINLLEIKDNTVNNTDLLTKCFEDLSSPILVSNSANYPVHFTDANSGQRQVVSTQIESKKYNNIRISQYCQITPDDITVGEDYLNLNLNYDLNFGKSINFQIAGDKGSVTSNNVYYSGVGW